MVGKISTEIRIYYLNFLNDIQYLEGGLILERQEDQDTEIRGK